MLAWCGEDVKKCRKCFGRSGLLLIPILYVFHFGTLSIHPIFTSSSHHEKSPKIEVYTCNLWIVLGVHAILINSARLISALHRLFKAKNLYFFFGSFARQESKKYGVFCVCPYCDGYDRCKELNVWRPCVVIRCGWTGSIKVKCGSIK